MNLIYIVILQQSNFSFVRGVVWLSVLGRVEMSYAELSQVWLSQFKFG